MEWFVHSSLIHGFDLKGYILVILSNTNFVSADFSCSVGDA